MTTATVDDRKRVRLPTAKPGQVFSVEPNPDGIIKLVPVVPKEPRRVQGRLVRKGGGLFLEIPKGYKLAPDAIERAVAEERASRA